MSLQDHQKTQKTTNNKPLGYDNFRQINNQSLMNKPKEAHNVNFSFVNNSRNVGQGGKMPMINSQKIFKPITILTDNSMFNNHNKNSSVFIKNNNVFVNSNNDQLVKNQENQVQNKTPVQNQKKFNNNIPIIPSPLYNNALQQFLQPSQIKIKQESEEAHKKIEEFSSHGHQMKSASTILLEEKYRIYLKYFRENILIQKQIARVNADKRILEEHLLKLKQSEEQQSLFNNQKSIENSISNNITSKDKQNSKKKRQRRNANQIVRKWKCPVQLCDRMYGTEASLLQHMKLKHETKYNQKKDQISQKINH